MKRDGTSITCNFHLIDQLSPTQVIIGSDYIKKIIVLSCLTAQCNYDTDRGILLQFNIAKFDIENVGSKSSVGVWFVLVRTYGTSTVGNILARRDRNYCSKNFQRFGFRSENIS